MATLIEEAARDGSWSTEGFSADRALSDWSELLSVNIAEMHVGSGAAQSYHASWRRIGLGPIDLNFLQAAPQRVEHTRAMAARQHSADYDLLYMRRGPADLRHCGVTMRVPEGCFVLLDNSEPYDLVFGEESSCLTAHFDDRWLRKWTPDPRVLTARPIDGTRDWASPLAAILRAIEETGLHGAVLPRSIIADQVGSLLALMAGQGAEPSKSRHQADLLARFKRRLRECFDDSTLDPAWLAQDIGVSKRHLHGVFAQAGTTFGAVLMEIRLARAADLLRDPRFASYRVGDVAWACGFADPSHFARRFREKHGKSPVDYRASGSSASSPAQCGDLVERIHGAGDFS